MPLKRQIFCNIVLGCVMATTAQSRTIIVPEHEPTIQAAINSAVDGDTVLVQPGTYTGPGNVDLRVKGVQLRIMGATSPRATVIDGESTTRILSVQNSGTKLVLERLTFANGRADRGGAILSNADLLQIFGCRFEGNRALEGGAIASTGHILAMTHCVMQGNRAEKGSAVHLTSTLSDVINCVVTENTAYNGGTLIAAQGELSLVNCTVVGNIGQALTFIATDAFVLNSILRNDAAEEIHTDRALEVSYTNIRGGWEGEGFGNIDTDPRFISRFGFDVFLAPKSPCIDAGSPYIYDRIASSHPRWPLRYPNGDRSDIGAFGGDDNIGWLHYR